MSQKVTQGKGRLMNYEKQIGKDLLLACCYVSIVRGTPAMIQVMLIYYSLSKLLELPDVSILGSSIARIIPGSIALGINSGAYTAEIFRSGIISVPKGQTEAGLSLGLDELTKMTSIVLPQAVRNVLPALCNEFISLIKESSVLLHRGPGFDGPGFIIRRSESF